MATFNELDLKNEIFQYLKDNLVIEISRDQDYYSHPHLEVKVTLEGELVSESMCTIYDDGRRDY